MPRRPPPPTSPRLNSQTPPPGSAETCLTPEQVNRWADVIAEGRDVFPEGLPSPRRERLLAAVRERLRNRLVRFIARAVAARLRPRALADKENPTHA
jgi:hypothetical protein